MKRFSAAWSAPFSEHFDTRQEVVERLSELRDRGLGGRERRLTWHPSYSPAAQPHLPVPVLLKRETSA
jgi:hypothetical protein